VWRCGGRQDLINLLIERGGVANVKTRGIVALSIAQEA
jgi:hypothetical protein